MSKIYQNLFFFFFMSLISGVDKDTLKWVKMPDALKWDDFNQGNFAVGFFPLAEAPFRTFAFEQLGKRNRTQEISGDFFIFFISVFRSRNFLSTNEKKKTKKKKKKLPLPSGSSLFTCAAFFHCFFFRVSFTAQIVGSLFPNTRTADIQLVVSF